MDSLVCFASKTYPVDSDFSRGKRNTAFEQLGPGVKLRSYWLFYGHVAVAKSQSTGPYVRDPTIVFSISRLTREDKLMTPFSHFFIVFVLKTLILFHRDKNNMLLTRCPCCLIICVFTTRK